MRTTQTITAIDRVTATTTSNKYYVGDAKRVAFQFRRADHDIGGSSAFAVKVSFDSAETVTPTMTTANVLINNVTNAITQKLTRVASRTLTADGDAFLFLDPSSMVNWVEITVTETANGTHSAYILIEK